MRGREPIGLDGEERRRRINPGLKESRRPRPAPAWHLTRGTHVNMLMLALSHYQCLICRVYLPFVCKGFVRSNFMNAICSSPLTRETCQYMLMISSQLGFLKCSITWNVKLPRPDARGPAGPQGRRCRGTLHHK